jgi:hypothetical protein
VPDIRSRRIGSESDVWGPFTGGARRQRVTLRTIRKTITQKIIVQSGLSCQSFLVLGAVTGVLNHFIASNCLKGRGKMSVSHSPRQIAGHKHCALTYSIYPKLGRDVPSLANIILSFGSDLFVTKRSEI